MLCPSYAHLCSEHFAECNFVNFKWWNTKWGLLQSGICRAIHKVTDLRKNPVRICKDEADKQQVRSTIPKTERYTDTLKQVLTRQRQKVHACGKERKSKPQMLVANKKWPP